MKPETEALLPGIEELTQGPGWIVLPNGAILCWGGVADIEFINCHFEGDEAHEPHTKEQHEK